MRPLETFVIVHSQDLVKTCEAEGRFRHLPQFSYLFVGPGDVSQVRHLDRLIVARDLPDNIEQFPKLLSFTGWYAVARNGLARTPWVSVLEYDVALSKTFAADTQKALTQAPDRPRRMVGYVGFPLSHPMYLHATPWLIPACRSVYGIDLPALIADHLAAGHPDRWTATTNISLGKDDLAAFVDWFLPMTPLFRDDPIGAHVHERTLPVFCLLHGLENHVLDGALQHVQARSHQFYARSWDEAQAEADRLTAPAAPPPPPAEPR